MLHAPEIRSGTTSTIIGIDPGSETLGVAVITFDIDSMKIVNTQAKTFIGSRIVDIDNWQGEIHGDRLGRIQAHKRNLLSIFINAVPISIACESPFYSQRRPSAFGVLMEVLTAIREAVLEYDSWKSLFIIDPPTVKKAVGAAGNGDKHKVREKVISLKELCYLGETSIEELDEHSIDAIAVAYCRFKSLTS